MSDAFRLPPVDDVVAAALAEDFGVTVEALLTPTPGLLERDVTGSLLPAAARFDGLVRARSAGVICGLPVACRVFEMLASASGFEAPKCFALVAEGSDVWAGRPVMEVKGPARLVLAGERTALDFLMVLSGIATTAARWQEAAGDVMNVTDTRKTLPGPGRCRSTPCAWAAR